MTADRDLDRRLLWIVKGFVVASGLALAAGLVLHVIQPERPLSASLLALGLILLMATPATRVVIATAERLRRADWLFVVVTVVVLLELAVALWFAASRV